MRSLVLIFSVFFVSISFAQEFSDVQKTLITKRTASWCPNCGTWGWEFAKAIEALENENAVLIRAHYSGDLMSDVADDITKNFQAFYQPEFFINEEKQEVGNSTWSSKVEAFKSEIETNASKASNVSFNMSGTITEDALSSDVKVTFLNNVEGDYYLATYVLEDGVINNQSGLGSNIEHNSVLRRSMSGESFGKMIVEGSVGMGTSVSNNTTISSSDEDLEGRNFRLLAVVWKKDGDRFRVENLHDVQVDRSSSTKSTLLPEEDLKLTVTATDISMVFKVPSDVNTAQISLIALDGRVLDQWQASVQSGRNELSRTLNNPLTQIVLVSISGNGRQLYSKKVTLR